MSYPLAKRPDLIRTVKHFFSCKGTEIELDQFSIQKTNSGFSISVSQAKKDGWVNGWVLDASTHVRIFKNEKENYVQLCKHPENYLKIRCLAPETVVCIRFRPAKKKKQHACLKLCNNQQHKGEIQVTYDDDAESVHLFTKVGNPLGCDLVPYRHSYSNQYIILLRVRKTDWLQLSVPDWSQKGVRWDVLWVDDGLNYEVLKQKCLLRKDKRWPRDTFSRKPNGYTSFSPEQKTLARQQMDKIKTIIQPSHKSLVLGFLVKKDDLRRLLPAYSSWFLLFAKPPVGTYVDVKNQIVAVDNEQHALYKKCLQQIGTFRVQKSFEVPCNTDPIYLIWKPQPDWAIVVELLLRAVKPHPPGARTDPFMEGQELLFLLRRETKACAK